MADSGDASSSHGSSASAAAPASATSHFAMAANATEEELLNLLLLKVQQRGGNYETVLQQAIEAANPVQAAAADASARAVQEQSRLARPGEGVALSLTPRSVAASVSSAHSASSAATARTPIMRHANHNDDAPFTVAADKINKVPDLTDSRHYPIWRKSFISFLAAYGIHNVLQQLPRYIVLPTLMEQLTLEEQRVGVAGYELHPAKVNESHATTRAETEYDKCLFISRALLRAVTNVPLAASVVPLCPLRMSTKHGADWKLSSIPIQPHSWTSQSRNSSC